MTRESAVWYATWLIPSVAVLIGLVTIETWLPEPFPRALTAEQENAALCSKFGLQAVSEQFQTCKSGLLELRTRDQAIDLL